jgi:hypothetical protein
VVVERGSLRQAELCPVKQGDVCRVRGHRPPASPSSEDPRRCRRVVLLY